jgi:hypothetical protein
MYPCLQFYIGTFRFWWGCQHRLNGKVFVNQGRCLWHDRAGISDGQRFDKLSDRWAIGSASASLSDLLE